MTCGACGREEYVQDIFRYCSGCGKLVTECMCTTYSLAPSPRRRLQPYSIDDMEEIIRANNDSIRNAGQ